jgi:hypothetical protein
MQGFYLGDRKAEVIGGHHPDCCSGYARVGRYELLFASVVGRSHLAARQSGNGKLYREDAFAVAGFGPWLVAALSDGVGGARESRFGAAFTVERSILHILSELEGPVTLHKEQTKDAARETGERGALLWDNQDGSDGERPATTEDEWQRNRWLLRSSAKKLDQTSSPTRSLDAVLENAYAATSEELIVFARSEGIDPACTLQTLLLNTETGHLAAGYLGDGLITGAWTFAQREIVRPKTTGEADTVCSLHNPDWKSFFTTQTLPAPVGRSLGAFHLMTDGVTEDCMGKTTFGPWARRIEERFDDLWARHIAQRFNDYRPLFQRNHDLAASLRAESKSSDDLSLALIFRMPPPAHSAEVIQEVPFDAK